MTAPLSNFPSPLAQIAVDWARHEQFIHFSGDRNPMHTDALAARRTPPGAIVTYGMQMLLWAMEELAARELVGRSLARIRLKFLKWIYLEDLATLYFLPGKDAATPDRIEVRVGSMLAITVELFRGDPQPVPPAIAGEIQPKRMQSRALSLAEMDGVSGTVAGADRAASASLYPALAATFGPHFAVDIADCSYVVGMEAPGLYSIDSKAEWTVHAPAPTGADAFSFQVTGTDERFRRARVQMQGRVLSCTLEAFVRNPPVVQPGVQQIAQSITPEEFQGVHALVIGGSRGLGEVAAKCIAAGGGRSTLTYAVGEQDALAVAGQIRAGGADAKVARYDVREAALPQLEAIAGPFTHLLYFATGPMFRPKAMVISAAHLAAFTQCYLVGFHDLCTALMVRQPGQPLTAFYPSSTLVAERGPGYTDFAATKAAGEQMCQDMQRYLPGLRVAVARLPRLLTDQTAPMVPERFPDTAEVLLRALRAMSAPGHTSLSS